MAPASLLASQANAVIAKFTHVKAAMINQSLFVALYRGTRLVVLMLAQHIYYMSHGTINTDMLTL